MMVDQGVEKSRHMDEFVHVSDTRPHGWRTLGTTTLMWDPQNMNIFCSRVRRLEFHTGKHRLTLFKSYSFLEKGNKCSEF